MDDLIQIQQLPNGLTLLMQNMPWLESAALSILVPAGSQRDPLEKAGLAGFTAEMVQRGCGPYNSRHFVEQLDRLGAARSASVTNYHTRFSAAIPTTRLRDTLELYRELILNPHLPPEQLEDSRMVAMQELLAMEDDLAQKLMREMRKRLYPDPYGRSTTGCMESVQSIELADVQLHVQQYYVPDRAIISIAGKIDFNEVHSMVESLFGSWQGSIQDELLETPPLAGHHHIQHETSQTQIGVVFPSVPYSDPDYFLARSAIGVLSDGMSSRLFTEVREKRGLCYTVYAMCHTIKDLGCVLAYAGTTTERAQETLDVMLAEIRRLGEGILDDELDRLKARIKTGLIMQQESSSSRSISMASDWHLLGKVRTLEQLSTLLDEVETTSINKYLEENPPQNFKVVTLGQQPLDTSGVEGATS